jgi:hypothetical protein
MLETTACRIQGPDLPVQLQTMASRRQLIQGDTVIQIRDNRGNYDYGVFDKCTDRHLCYRKPGAEGMGRVYTTEYDAVTRVVLLDPLLVVGYLNLIKLKMLKLHSAAAELQTFEQIVDEEV